MEIKKIYSVLSPGGIQYATLALIITKLTPYRYYLNVLFYQAIIREQKYKFLKPIPAK